MSEIAGIPYLEACFDKRGALASPVRLPTGVTDLIAVSHGWNNTAEEARGLYRELFGHFVEAASPGSLTTKKFAILGVIWPSRKFGEPVETGDGPLKARTGSEGTARRPDGRCARYSKSDMHHVALEAALNRLQDLFFEPEERRILEKAKALVQGLENQASARRAFADRIRSLLDPSATNREDASDTFFRLDGEDLMRNLRIAGGNFEAQSGGTAEFANLLAEFAPAAIDLLNFAAYYEMKARSGTVGKLGLAPLIDRLAPAIERVHLTGHSFGARLVTSAAAHSTTAKLNTLILLQAAFSHNGFSRRENGFFRSVIDKRRIDGPVLITHTRNDEAVGIAYPIASRINGDRTTALGDENDQFGGLGRNGAQHMESGELVKGSLLGETSEYSFQRGRLFNLEASEFILSHGDVTGIQVAHAMCAAVAPRGNQNSRY